MVAVNDKERALDLIEDFGPLTLTELLMYFKRQRDRRPEITTNIIKNLDTKGLLSLKDGIVKHFPSQSIKTKNFAAFWVYLAFVRDTEQTAFKAKYPSNIGFVKDEVYLITVCEDPTQDKELIALREKEKDDVVHIIVGVNIKREEIRKEILPRPPYIFATLTTNDIINDVPKISFEKIES